MKIIKILRYKSNYILQFIIIFLITLLIVSTFKPLLVLICFILLNEILRFVKRNTDLNFGFEHVTIAAVIMGRITNIPFALFSIAIMIFMKEIRNNQFGFKGLGIKSFFWIVIVLISHLFAGYSLALVGITLVTIRYLVFDLIIPLKSGNGYDLHLDTINWFYNAFIIKLLSYFL